jgi:hypothetical protein
MKIHEKKAKSMLAVMMTIALSIAGLSVFYESYLESHTSAQASATPGIPTSYLGKPPFVTLLNGSAKYPSYTIAKGHSAVIFVDIVSNQTYPISLKAYYQSPTGILPPGITLKLPVNSAATPVSHMPVVIRVDNTATPGLYPMSIDATHMSGQERMTFGAGFNLLVEG